MKYQPGQSGNPNGRPRKEQTLTDLLRKFMNKKIEVASSEGEKLSVKRKELFIEQCFNLAMKGDTIAAKYLFDRMDGKLSEKNELSGPNGQPLQSESIIRVEINNAGTGTKDPI